MKIKIDDETLKQASILILGEYLDRFAKSDADEILEYIKEQNVIVQKEFSDEQLEDIRNEYIESIMIAVPGEINCVHRDMLAIINICQTKLGEPEYSSVEELLAKEGAESTEGTK